MPTSSSLASSLKRSVQHPPRPGSTRTETDPQYPEYKDKIVIVLKGGSTNVFKEMTWDTDRNREMILEATKIIGKKPEIYSIARVLPGSDFDEIFGNMKTLQDEGLFGAFGASEMKRESLERANKVGHSFFPLLQWGDTVPG